MNNIQLTGKIHWIPPYSTGKDRYPPSTVFETYGKFTADDQASFTLRMSYSPECDNGFHDVVFFVPYADTKHLVKLIKYSNLVIFNGHNVFAVCKDIAIKD